MAQVQDNQLIRISKSEYDTANRPMRITHRNSETDNHLYTGEVSYDPYNNLSSFREQVGVGRTPYRTDFTYDKENKPTLITFGDTNNKVAYAYDALGRMVTRTTTVGGNAATSTYAYVAGGHGTGSTTPLIASITQGNDESCAYTYDNVGNIVSSTRGTVTTTYAYDPLGQLIRVNDPGDTSAGAAGTTWLYAYDRGGNILNKKKYAYTTGAVGTVLQTITYGYDATWKDKLSSYNGVSITYDQIGNPLNDGLWTYRWEKGRQLKQMTKPGTTVAYAYNAEGLRIRKTVNGAETNYTLHGKNVVHMTRGANSLHFWYDAQSRPAIVDFNGTKYAYILNLQGDVVGIQNASGTEVVRYTYDAWGKLLDTSGSLAATLGVLNPFRYRGYVYDEETGLYYLRSRYYNPVWNRFVNADFEIHTETDLFDAKLFCYARNNPITYTDPDGKWFWDKLKEVAEAALAIAVAVVVIAVVVVAVVGTGGGAGFALAGAGALASAATATAAAAIESAVVVGAAAVTTLAASRMLSRSGRPQGSSNRTPNDNQAQNKQFDDVIRALRKEGINLSKEQQRMLHQEISHQGYGYQEIIQIGRDMFGGI